MKVCVKVLLLRFSGPGATGCFCASRFFSFTFQCCSLKKLFQLQHRGTLPWCSIFGKVWRQWCFSLPVPHKNLGSAVASQRAAVKVGCTFYNKHIKNRSTPFRWTSLRCASVGLLCGRYWAKGLDLLI